MNNQICFSTNYFLLLVVAIIGTIIWLLYTLYVKNIQLFMNGNVGGNGNVDGNGNVGGNVGDMMVNKPKAFDPETIDDLVIGEVPPVRRDYRKIYDPLKKPTRRYVDYPTGIVPLMDQGGFNIPTQGYFPNFHMAGFLVDKNDSNKTLKLFVRRTDREKYEYYATHHKDHTLKLPLSVRGDKELYEGDRITVPSYGNTHFTVNLYDLEAPQYVPYV